MKIANSFSFTRATFLCSVATIAATICLMGPLGVRSEAQTAMAPPVWVPQDNLDYDSSSVFNWSDVPEDQQVTIERAVFDQGGYQLYDSADETIVVPFVNNNLYVMKFARSTNGSMYFVNDGDSPVLYVPRGGYIENATVPGARWYPFTAKFHPSTPVYLGIAPSWNAYVGMGWYSDMYYHGGYYGNAPYGSSVFVAVPGFAIQIGSYTSNDWHSYHGYWKQYGAPYHTGYRDQSVYTAPRASWNGRGNHDGGRSDNGDRPGGRAFQGSGGTQPGRTYGGGSTTGHSYTGNGGTQPGRTYGGGSSNTHSNSNSGGSNASPRNSTPPQNSGGSRSFWGGSNSSGTHSSGTGANNSTRASGGGSPGNATGNNSHSNRAPHGNGGGSDNKGGGSTGNSGGSGNNHNNGH